MKELNKNELLVGFVFGLSFWCVLGAWAVPLALVTSLGWALTGAGYSKLYRRFAVPALPCILVIILHQYYCVLLSYPLAVAMLHIGYGTPTLVRGRDDYDEGSTLGQFWYRITSGSEWLTNVLTRATIYLGLFISYFMTLWKIV